MLIYKLTDKIAEKIVEVLKKHLELKQKRKNMEFYEQEKKGILNCLETLVKNPSEHLTNGTDLNKEDK
ncbi:hypothetical protein [Bacillus massiliigorillae]|uniref:hypothetical protein n=1 Tax=Bacillus massiliigorillae TaxID=1243664 RepID=UPI0003A6F9C4|nr:hypothetical protein [Bacillus massiliigorillae]